MDVISVASSILAVIQLTTSVVRYINDVNDGQEERLSLRNEIISAYGPLQMLHDRIVDEEKRAAAYPRTPNPWLSSVMALAAKWGPLEQYADVLQTLQREKDKFMNPSEKRLKVVAKHLAWPFKRTDVEKYMKVVERQKMMFLLALQNDNLTLAQAIKEDTSLLPEMSERLGDIAETVGKMSLSNNVVDRRTIVKWLSPLNFFPTHDFIIGQREPGTGQWLLDSSIFKSWVNGESKTLWCPGIPGAGKTMLSSIIVDNLRNQFEYDSGVGVASIYCNYKEEDEQTQENLLAGIWRQLIHNKNALSGDVKILYNEHADKDTRPTLDAVAEVLTKEVARYRVVYVVVDALDECPEVRRIRLMERLQTIQNSQTELRLLVTSRMYDSIARHFEGQPRLEIKASTEDVRAYVRGRIAKGSRLERHVLKDPTLARDIENAVAGKAEKMFLLAQLHMDSLQETGSPRAVRKALAGLPEDLDATYERAMERIAVQGKHDRLYAELILQWISFAKRQLSLDELLEALAVEEDTEELDRSNILDAELLTSVCCGLVIVDHMSNIVRLVHFSTQEYFKRIRSVRFPIAQEQISRTCLTYLSYDVFAEGACPDDATADSRIEKNHLLWYAAENWGEHVRGIPETVLEDQILDLLSDNGKISSVAQAMHFHPDKNWQVGTFAKDVTGLHLAAHFGLQHIMNRLLEDGANVSVKDSLGATPLHEAAEGGHADVVQALLSKGADIEAQDSEGLTALHRATQSGHKEIVLILLNHGAAISKAIDGRTALHFAVEFGNDVIAKALLGNGADATAVSNEIPDDIGLNKFLGGRTPLHWAAEYGYTSLAKLLLESGANVNAMNTSGRTPLQEAIMWGHVPMAELLLEQGASVSIQDSTGWSPLHEAAFRAPPEITTMLLDRGADPECINMISNQKWIDGHVPEGDDYVNGGRTPLYMALRYGRYSVVEVLLKKGADLRHRDFYGVSPLHLCVMYEEGGWDEDRIPVLNALLDAQEDIEEKLFGFKETPLHMAARAGRADCVRFLLERGADKSVKNLKGETAEMIAEAAGREDAARILKEFGVEGGKSQG